MRHSGVWLEYGPGGRPAAFAAPREVVVAWQPAEVAPALARLDAARAGGAWVAGWVGYEAGAAFEPRLGGVMRGEGPLLVLGVFDGPSEAVVGSDGGVGPLLGEPVPAVSRKAYGQAVARVLDLVAAGDCYQVNLTFPLEARLLPGVTPAMVHARLEPSGHGAFVDLGVGPALVSRSPELFVRVTGGTIEARPMKGTAPRDADPGRDAALGQALLASEKARAENLMIVDLLRNDIGRISATGSVRVPALFALETHPTVHQMTSTVTGRLDGPASLGRLLPALFPCGSVTGAPKIRAMQVIRDVEPHPRGIYCGAVGWMAPGGDCDWSVAIRTLSIEGDRVTLGVGGGIVADSTADGEWEEALWKARFLRPAWA